VSVVVILSLKEEKHEEMKMEAEKDSWQEIEMMPRSRLSKRGQVELGEQISS
jgi:hypothetical protein